MTDAPPPGGECLSLDVIDEIHDGVLQFLTAAGLQIEVILRLGERDPSAAFERLHRLGRALSEEQRELRLFVEEVREASAPVSEPAFAARLRATVDRISALWDVEIALTIAPDCPVPASRAHDVTRMVQEASVNAVRHGGATSLDIDVTSTAGANLSVEVRDDGRGFPFVGTFTDEELWARRLGPQTLKRRVRSLGGRMSIVSGPDGAVLRVDVPFADAT